MLPEPHYQDDHVTLYCGDCRDVLPALETADLVLTDPPYGLEFMGKDWDRPWAVSAENKTGYTGRGDFTLPSHRDNRNANCRKCGGRQRGSKRCVCDEPSWDRDPSTDMRQFQEWAEAWARAAFRLLKPGGHLLSFGGTRTHHRMAAGVEDAGFEIRDMLAWMYGTGFPKSLNLDGEWDGWGTALKPAFEPIVLARKPLIGTVAQNVSAHRVGALHIDACRINPGEHVPGGGRSFGACDGVHEGWKRPSHGEYEAKPSHNLGRWPANVVLDEDAAAMLDAQSGSSVSRVGKPRGSTAPGEGWGMTKTGSEYADFGGASRFFKVAESNDDELLFWRAKAIMDAWNSDLAATVDNCSVLPSETVDSALSRAAIAASLGVRRLSSWTAHGTSITPTRLKTLCESAIMLILSSDSGRSLALPLDGRTQSLVRVSGAEIQGLTATTTTMTVRLTFDGCAVDVTLVDTSSSMALGEAVSPTRFRYCAKASKRERGDGNNHPTVKPLSLMRWLIRLALPVGGVMVDPFAGSGSTLLAAKQEGARAIGVELNPDYCEIIVKRLRDQRATQLELAA